MVYWQETMMNPPNCKRIARLSAVLALAYLQSVYGSQLTDSDLRRYKFTNRAVLYDGVSAYEIDEGKTDESFKGPVLLGDRIVIVSSVHNRVLLFAGEAKLKKEIKVQTRIPRMFYPDRPFISVVVNLGSKLLLYNSDGRAYLLEDDSFKLKRMRSIEFDPDKYGNPYLLHYTPFKGSNLTIPCSLKDKNDYEVVLNLKQMTLDYCGEVRVP